ncbi:p53 and DNA damage-regulated protein 1 isoform X2 [Paroedura picta]|uniref:p53 and DNA damage-regulated protein 1 isoform X2 n=1 Tax=Paroedura picta TaxID=143630 RepID=UPI004056CB0B
MYTGLQSILFIVALDQKRNQNREALRALSKELAGTEKVQVCFGSMFVQLPHAQTKDMLQRDQELLDKEIASLREELKVKVGHLLEAQGKPELKGYSLKPLSGEETWFIKKVLDG